MDFPALQDSLSAVGTARTERHRFVQTFIAEVKTLDGGEGSLPLSVEHVAIALTAVVVVVARIVEGASLDWQVAAVNPGDAVFDNGVRQCVRRVEGCRRAVRKARTARANTGRSLF